MDSFNKLAELFRQFPGIGPRQAKRFVYFLLSREPSFLEELTKLIGVLKQEIVQCTECFRYYQRRNSNSHHMMEKTISLCSICVDPNRATGELMVVAKDTDLDAMEKSGTYHGKYFVLGGTISLIERKAPEKLRMKELLSHVERLLHPRSSERISPSEIRAGASASDQRGSAPLKEVILALSANPDGEHTSGELKSLLSPTGVKLTTLGRGLSTGSELEYADKETLKSALQNRST